VFKKIINHRLTQINTDKNNLRSTIDNLQIKI